MAEKTRAWGFSGEKSESGSASLYRVISVANLNNHASEHIAPYSIVTKVIAYSDVYQKIALGSTKTDFEMFFSSGEEGYYLDSVKHVYNKKEVIPKDSWTYIEQDITSCFTTSGATPGRVNVDGAVTFSFHQYCGVIRTLKMRDTYIRWYWTSPTFVLSLSSSSGGTVSGGGTYEVDSTATIKATPNTGYKFVKWNDGNTNAERQITITSSEISANVTNRSYTAYFEIDKTYVTYDSIFNFKKWAENNLTSWQFMNIYNVTDTGFTGTALVDDAYTQECRPLIPVVVGKEYILEVDVETNVGFQLFVFFCDANGAWGNLAYGSNQRTVNFVPTTNYISIRCDIDGTGNVGTFSNFRIYPADCPYMGSTVSATERLDVNAWSMPTPTREGYRFLGWFTQPNGGGVQYTSSSAFPIGGADLVLYSHWEIAKINKIYIGTSQPKAIYVGTQEVKEVYVGTTKVYG